MRISKYLTISILLTVGGVVGCTKLQESYTSTVPANQAATALGPGGLGLLLNAAYQDLITPYLSDQAEVFNLQENSTDESIVAVRGADWDDNGAWRAVHAQSWNADLVTVTSTYNNLNKLNFDATNVLSFKPTPEIAAEARVLRAYALYTLLDLFDKYPFRNPGDTLLNAPKVLTGAPAMQFIIDELTAVLPDLIPSTPTTPKNKITSDVANVLLMKCYLNRGAFLHRASPTFDAGDMQKVADIGNAIILSGNYSYATNYFTNFAVTNGAGDGTDKSPELIWGYASATGQASGNPRVDTRWCMTFHYNEYSQYKPGAGWNGFSTTSDFYSTWGGVNGGPATTGTQSDSALDTRFGGRFTSNPFCTQNSGIKPGFMVGQQYNADGSIIKDRNGNNLSFTIGGIPDNMLITGPGIEVAGVRVCKFVPDINGNGANFQNTPGNWMVWMRYPEVVLMVAEAYMRGATGPGTALALVNTLRAARGATPMGPMTLAGATTKDPNTLLAERGRELYWESLRRTDLIRFGLFLTPWTCKTNTSPTYLVYPIPNQALAVNPNLTQNPGYTQ